MSTPSTPPAAAGRPTLQSILDNGRLAWRLMQDDRVPTVLKVVIPLVVAVYFISPMDLIPDFIPVLGQLDDLGVLLLATTVFINLAPRDVVSEHRAALGLGSGAGGTARGPGAGGQKTTVIDGSYHPADPRQA